MTALAGLDNSQLQLPDCTTNMVRVLHTAWTKRVREHDWCSHEHGTPVACSLAWAIQIRLTLHKHADASGGTPASQLAEVEGCVTVCELELRGTRVLLLYGHTGGQDRNETGGQSECV